MGKEGPCYHCGVTSTPLWRNGPPEKPILCNACGSRWRTKGTLSNYTPLHVRAKADEYEDLKDSKRKTVYFKERDVKMKKGKLCSDNSVVKRYASEANYNQDFLKMTYEDTSNRSSSGSAVSNLENCAQFSSVDASGSSGPAQSFALELQVPSKKRTCVIHTKSSPVEKLIKDLHAIMHEQESSCLSGFSEEDLLFESNEPMVSVEIGHGSVLIKHPSSMVREEESEASSLSAENKPSAVNDSYSCSASLCWRNYLKSDNVCYHGSGNISNLTGKIMQQETAKRDKFNHDRMQLFWTHDSALCCIDLNDVINFEALLGHLTIDEQQQLLKYLPSDDTFQFPGSLRDMFDSDCFKENLLYFQQLLSEGVFSNTDSGVKSKELKTLKKLALSNLAKSKWMELYSKLKDSRSNHRAGGNQVASASKLSSLKDLGSAKTPLHEPIKFTPDKETTLGRSSISSLGNKETLNGDGSYMIPRTLFSLPIDGHCITLESCKFPDESSDHDLLLDIPSNGCFPEAELLLPTSSFVSYQTSASSSSRFLAQS